MLQSAPHSMLNYAYNKNLNGSKIWEQATVKFTSELNKEDSLRRHAVSEWKKKKVENRRK